LISRLFFIFFRSGLLRFSKSFYCHYNVGNLIKKGDVIIDIGANLGYYTRIFAEISGEEGKVYAVEPVALFTKILARNLSGYKNVEIILCALGKSDNLRVKMGIPGHFNYFSHGRTHIIDDSESEKCCYITEAVVRNPSILFSHLKKLDYIKCDIEGFESEVIPEMAELIRRFRPVIQIETSGDARQQIYQMLNGAGYYCYRVEKSGFVKMENELSPSYGDLIFIPTEKLKKLIFIKK
ncbi:MAG: FkbM family methyltransferase, partial [Bacteroidales bacterium]